MPNKCWCGNKDLQNYSEEYYKCNKCYSLVSKRDFDNSITHIKNEDTDLYGKNYWETKMLHLSGMGSINDLVDMYLKERGIYWLRYLLKYILPGTLIAEIGCGLGQFPYLIKQTGYKQEAFELSKDICAYSSRELKINISNDVIQKSQFSFDAILAFDLIEHLTDPKNFISELLDKLETNGILCFQTPCYDENLSYEDMLKFKPKFEQLLISNEHIFLFSKTSIEYLLKDIDVNYIQFEPAFFGDDYDMFVFASRKPMKINTSQEIEKSLNSIENGRIIKALLALFEEKAEVIKKLQKRENDATTRLENIEILTKQLKITEEDSKARLKNIEILTKQIEISEKDRSARLDIMNNQNIIIEEKDKEKEEIKKKIEEIKKEIEKKDNIINNLHQKHDEMISENIKVKSGYDELLSEKNSLKLTLKNLKRLLFHG